MSFARLNTAFLRADDANLTLKIKEIDCDIIGFDEKYKFEVRRGSVKAAIDRNVQFEFNYR